MRLHFFDFTYYSENGFPKMMSCMGTALAYCKDMAPAYLRYLNAKRDMKCSGELKDLFYYLFISPATPNRY